MTVCVTKDRSHEPKCIKSFLRLQTTETYENYRRMMPCFKVLTVGDDTVGKTTLLMTYAYNEFPKYKVPLLSEYETVTSLYKGKPMTLSLEDSVGSSDYDKLRAVTYPGTKVVLICFAINSYKSLSNVEEKWYPEVRHHLAKAPIILVGTKSDLRDPESDGIVSEVKCKAVAKRIGAKKYIECSAQTSDNVNSVFNEVMRVCYEVSKSPRKKVCTLI